MFPPACSGADRDALNAKCETLSKEVERLERLLEVVRAQLDEARSQKPTTVVRTVVAPAAASVRSQAAAEATTRELPAMSTVDGVDTEVDTVETIDSITSPLAGYGVNDATVQTEALKTSRWHLEHASASHRIPAT